MMQKALLRVRSPHSKDKTKTSIALKQRHSRESRSTVGCRVSPDSYKIVSNHRFSQNSQVTQIPTSKLGRPFRCRLTHNSPQTSQRQNQQFTINRIRLSGYGGARVHTEVSANKENEMSGLYIQSLKSKSFEKKHRPSRAPFQKNQSSKTIARVTSPIPTSSKSSQTRQKHDFKAEIANIYMSDCPKQSKTVHKKIKDSELVFKKNRIINNKRYCIVSSLDQQSKFCVQLTPLGHNFQRFSLKLPAKLALQLLQSRFNNSIQKLMDSIIINQSKSACYLKLTKQMTKPKLPKISQTEQQLQQSSKMRTEVDLRSRSSSNCSVIQIDSDTKIDMQEQPPSAKTDCQ